MDKKLNLKLALKDPQNCSDDELGEILDAQLHAVRYLHSMGITKEAAPSEEVTKEVKLKNKSGVGKRKALRRLKNKI